MKSENCDEDVDLYDDLPDFNMEASLHKLETENKVLSQKVKDLSSRVTELETQNTELNRMNKNLRANISALVKTVQKEIQRKDTTINELRQEREDLFFRRKKPYNGDARPLRLEKKKPVDETGNSDGRSKKDASLPETATHDSSAEKKTPEAPAESVSSTGLSRNNLNGENGEGVVRILGGEGLVDPRITRKDNPRGGTTEREKMKQEIQSKQIKDSPTSIEHTVLAKSTSPKSRGRKGKSTRLYVKTRSSARLSAKLSAQETSNEGEVSVLEALQLEERIPNEFANSPMPEIVSPIVSFQDNEKSLSPVRFPAGLVLPGPSSLPSSTPVSSISSLLQGALIGLAACEQHVSSLSERETSSQKPSSLPVSSDNVESNTSQFSSGERIPRQRNASGKDSLVVENALKEGAVRFDAPQKGCREKGAAPNEEHREEGAAPNEEHRNEGADRNKKLKKEGAERYEAPRNGLKEEGAAPNKEVRKEGAGHYKTPRNGLREEGAALNKELGKEGAKHYEMPRNELRKAGAAPNKDVMKEGAASNKELTKEGAARFEASRKGIREGGAAPNKEIRKEGAGRFEAPRKGLREEGAALNKELRKEGAKHYEMPRNELRKAGAAPNKEIMKEGAGRYEAARSGLGEEGAAPNKELRKEGAGRFEAPRKGFREEGAALNKELRKEGAKHYEMPRNELRKAGAASNKQVMKEGAGRYEASRKGIREEGAASNKELRKEAGAPNKVLRKEGPAPNEELRKEEAGRFEATRKVLREEGAALNKELRKEGAKHYEMPRNELRKAGAAPNKDVMKEGAGRYEAPRSGFGEEGAAPNKELRKEGAAPNKELRKEGAAPNEELRKDGAGRFEAPRKGLGEEGAALNKELRKEGAKHYETPRNVLRKEGAAPNKEIMKEGAGRYEAARSALGEEGAAPNKELRKEGAGRFEASRKGLREEGAAPNKELGKEGAYETPRNGFRKIGAAFNKELQKEEAVQFELLKTVPREKNAVRNEERRTEGLRKEEGVSKVGAARSEENPRQEDRLHSGGEPCKGGVNSSNENIQNTPTSQQKVLNNISKETPPVNSVVLKNVNSQDSGGHNVTKRNSDSSALQCNFTVRRRTKVVLKVMVKTPPTTPNNTSEGDTAPSNCPSSAHTDQTVSGVVSKSFHKDQETPPRKIAVVDKVIEKPFQDAPQTASQISMRDKSPRDFFKKAHKDTATLKYVNDTKKRFYYEACRRSRSRSRPRYNTRENFPPVRPDHFHYRHRKGFRSPPFRSRHSRRDDFRGHGFNFSRRSRSLSPRFAFRQQRQGNEDRVCLSKLPADKKEREMLLFGTSPDRTPVKQCLPQRPVVLTVNVRRKKNIQLEDEEVKKSSPMPKPVCLSVPSQLVQTPIDFREKNAQVFSNAGESSDPESGALNSESESSHARDSDDSYRPNKKRKGGPNKRTNSKKRRIDDGKTNL